MTEWSPKEWFEFYPTMEKAGAINQVWIFPYYCQRQHGPSKCGFICADHNDNADADLSYKYQSKIEGWSVQIMTYLRKFLPKEVNEILTQCGTDGHQAVQLLYLKFHPINLQYQTDQCKTVPVQGNLTINAYTSNYNWYVINRALILDQKNDISDEYTQDMFISNMKRCDDVRSIVTFERTSPDQWIKDQYKGENFMNTMSNQYNGLPPTNNTSGRAFGGHSQTNVHNIVSYDVENKNNGDDWNGPSEYDYCRPGDDPDFGSYQSLMSISYNDCDVNTLAYKTCNAERIYNNSVMSISPNLNRAFDTTCPCAICGKSRHTFDDREELRD